MSSDKTTIEAFVQATPAENIFIRAIAIHGQPPGGIPGETPQQRKERLLTENLRRVAARAAKKKV